MSIQIVSRTPFVRLLRNAIGLFLLLTLGLAANAADTGRVGGTVVSKSTGNALQGAQVSIQGRLSLTDESGHFVIYDVPVGPTKVMASYSGFKDLAQDVIITAGNQSDITLTLETSDVVTLEAFTVQSVKEGQALSITEQRKAINQKTVASLDEWGILPTQNVGELAMRMPGVTFTVDTDDDVVNNVSIRGQPSSFTRLNIDGMPSTGVGGDGRSATLYSFSGAQYEQIEIIAGQTPDKRADSLGGQLNLKTRSPLAMKEKRRIKYNLSGRWAAPFSNQTPLRKDHPLHPTASMSYEEVFSVFGGHRNLGISATASYTENVNAQASNQLLYRNTTDQITPFYDYADYYGINHRGVTGMSLKADYRISDRSTVSFSALYNIGAEPYYRRTTISPFGNSTVATLDSNGQPTGTGSILPDYTEHTTNIRAVGTTMRLENDAWSFHSKNPTFTFTGKNDFDRLKLEYGARYSYTHWDSGSGRNQEGGALNIRTSTPIGFTLNNSDLNGKVFTQTSGADIFDANSYKPTTNGSTNYILTKRKTLADTTETSFRFDATYNFDTQYPLSIKTGFDYLRRVVDQGKGRDRRWTRVVGAPALSGPLVPITRFETVNLDGRRLPLYQVAAFNSELSDPALWTEDLTYAAARPWISRRWMREVVPAAYVQTQGQFKNLTVLGGVRFEKVDMNAYTYFKRLSTTPAQEPDVYKRAELDYQQSYVPPGNYTQAFPSAHLAYNLTPNLKARGSYSTSYGRPTILQLTPTPTVNETTQTVTSGNGNLKPQQADNVDLKLEYAFKSNGLVSLGYFKKTIKNYISPTGTLIGQVPDGPNNGYDGLYAGYDIIAFTNLGTATAEGLEFDYRQRLTFLPGLLKGLTLSANYTAIRTDGDFGGTVTKKGNDIPGFVPRTGNIRLLYNYKKFGVSTAVNYTSKHIVGFSAIGSTANYYRKDLTTYNVGATYRILPDVTLYVDVVNVTEVGAERYTYYESRTRSLWNGAMTVSFGISGQF